MAQRRGAALLVVLLLLLALMARESLPAGGLAERDRESVVEVTDAHSAWHHRRIALALSTSRLLQTDRFLSFPGTAANPDLPVFDGLLAFLARLMPNSPAGPPGLPPDERRLEDFLRGVGPALSLVWLALLYRLSRRVGRGTLTASLGTLALASLAPIAVAHGAAGRLHVEGLAAILFVVQIGLLAPVWRQREPLDRLFFAMLAGFVTGLGLATTPLFLAPLFAAWAAFLFAGARERGAERQNSARTALLFWITSALVGQLPVLGGPWLPAETGPIAGWAEVLGTVFLVGALPLALLLAAPARACSARLVIGGIVLGAALLFGALVWLGPDAEAAALAHAALGRGVGAAPIELALLAGPGIVWVLAFLGALVEGRTAEPGAERVFLAIAGVLTLLAALVHAPAVLLFAAPASLCLTRLLSGTRWTRPALFGLAAALLWSAVGLVSPPRDAAGEALVQAARWLRREGGPTGPWSSATAVQQEGVLADDRAAPLVAWHGRRAVATFGAWRAGDPAGRRSLEHVLAVDDPRELARRARRLGLRYLVLGPASPGRLARVSANAELLERLRVDSAEGDGFRLRWASEAPRVVVLEVLSPG